MVSLREGDGGGNANLSMERVLVGVSMDERDGEAGGASDRVRSAKRSAVCGRPSFAIPSAARERSSHFPRTALISRLPPTRWEGVHLLVAFGVVDPVFEFPVGVARRVLRDCELARERVPPREDVRSSKAFWYAN